LITNKVVLPGSDTPPATHMEVLDSVKKRQPDIQNLVKDIIIQIGQGNDGTSALPALKAKESKKKLSFEVSPSLLLNGLTCLLVAIVLVKDYYRK
jgi:hypothetical protein